MKSVLIKREDGTLSYEVKFENDKEKVKNEVKNTIDINDEIKILRETLEKVIKLVPLNTKDIEEFIEYIRLIKSIKEDSK